MSVLYKFLSLRHISDLHDLESDATKQTKNRNCTAKNRLKKTETDTNPMIIKPCADSARLQEIVTCRKKVINGRFQYQINKFWNPTGNRLCPVLGQKSDKTVTHIIFK